MAVQRCTKAAVGPPCRHKLFAKLWSGLLVSRDEGGSREHALKWRPSFTPSFARLPSFKNAAPRRTGSKTTPAPASTKHAYNSTFGGGASAGQGNDKYAANLFAYLNPM